MRQALGIDIGGTFIDIVLTDGESNRLFKFPSTPDAPERGVLLALEALIERGVLRPSDVHRIVHGSTVATNALLESRWAKTALLTTGGFRDVLEIGRQDRPELYDLDVVRPDAIVPRHLRLECSERLDASGHVVRPLLPEELHAVAQSLGAAGVEAVAVVFLFCYLNPDHERQARRVLERLLDCPVTVSSDVLPEFREFERTSTTVVCAALRPLVERYLRDLVRGAADLEMTPAWQIMQSNGTVIGADQAGREPVRLLLSGPAAGVEGARLVAERIGEDHLISLDMGGTSCDVALIHGGAVGQSTHGSVGGHPVAVRMNEIHTIGAGGGSIAWVDAGGALRVGPRSAGALPGPACYGRGGTEPTVSDAHAVLGHLRPEWPLGDLARFDVDAARMAVQTVAAPLSLSLEDAALGILDVADAAMERAVRVISVERGHDPRGFSLLAFGGAGPMHAVSIAKRLSIPRVIIPAAAGVLSALGLLASVVGRDYGQSVVRPIRSLSEEDVASMLHSMEMQGRDELNAEGVPDRSILCDVSADLRYQGQSHELCVRRPDQANQTELAPLQAWTDAFHAEHRVRYGHASPEEEVEFVALRVRMTGPATFCYHGMTHPDRAMPPSRAPVWFGPEGPVETAIVDRRGLKANEPIRGPAVLWGPEATVLVPPGCRGHVVGAETVLLEVP